MMRSHVLVLLALVSGCDYSADFLFVGQIDGVDDVLVIRPDDSQYITPADIQTYDDIAENAIFAEVSQSTTATLGGATLEFIGTGGPVCAFVDPETVFWSAAVAPNPSELGRQYSYPDNPFDDGDIDISGGLSVFYTGSPDEQMGDFVVFYEDELGNDVPIELVECVTPRSELLDADGQAGKGYPEYCTFSTTQEGVAYTVAMTAWSVPLDDDRLSFGVVLANGTCADLISVASRSLEQATVNSNAAQLRECVVTGESLRPEDAGPHFGRPDDLVWEGSLDLEAAFCRIQGEPRLDNFCASEADDRAADDEKCDWEAAGAEGDGVRCFCGDPNDLPNPGAG
jgi:hypothetical protein